MGRLLTDLRTHPRTVVFTVMIYGLLAAFLVAELKAAAPAATDEWSQLWAEFSKVSDAEWEALLAASDAREQDRLAREQPALARFADHWDALAQGLQSA